LETVTISEDPFKLDYKLHHADYNITLLKTLGCYTVLESMVIHADVLFGGDDYNINEDAF